MLFNYIFNNFYTFKQLKILEVLISFLGRKNIHFLWCHDITNLHDIMVAMQTGVVVFYNLFIAVCKDSYVVYACGFDRNGKWEWFCQSKLRCKNDIAEMTLQKWHCKMTSQALT